jgi:hypothetical protein
VAVLQLRAVPDLKIFLRTGLRSGDLKMRNLVTHANYLVTVGGCKPERPVCPPVFLLFGLAADPLGLS